ncbi:hypothetical protein [Burkholderia multivorans]|uniref:hypothetical protein n=1 Tax=Burkholderia multivorans TaxID=87883 RepID=UPI0019D28796|nr:hypothetical protein [Burkholderia multivorans]MBN6728522.1 hypothetical protein [Burkholderia multivorans]
MLFARTCCGFAACGILCQASAFAATAILAPQETVDKKCASQYESMGLYCQRDGEERPTIPETAPGIPLSTRQQFDSPSIRVTAILHLTPMQTAAGFGYYVLTTERFKTGILTQSFSPTDRFEREILQYVRNSGLPLVDASSQQAAAYLYERDVELAARAARAADERARQAQAQAAIEFQNSPAGKAASSKQAVAECRRTIANARRVLAQDDRIAAVSGTTDLLLRRQAGAAIVNCQDVIARNGQAPAP